MVIDFTSKEIEAIYSAAKEAHQKYYARTLTNDKFSVMTREANLKRVALYDAIMKKIDIAQKE